MLSGNNTIRITAKDVNGGPTIDYIIFKEIPKNIIFNHDFSKDSISMGWTAFNLNTDHNPPWVEFQPTQANAVLFNYGVPIPKGNYIISYDIKGAICFYITDGFGSNSKYYYYQNMNERHTSRTVTDTLIIDDNSGKIFVFNYLLNDTLGVSDIVVYANSIASDIYESSSKKSIVSIYPNPISNLLNFESQNKTLANIFIYDITGRVVFEHNYTKQLDLSSLQNGIYIVRLSNNYGEFIDSKKIIIQK